MGNVQDKPFVRDRFAGKVAIVSGAAQGIGHETALRLAREGATVVLLDRSERIFQIAPEVGAGDGVWFSLRVDMESYTECHRAIQSVAERFGRVDVLVNNVGGTIWMKPYARYEEAQIEAEIRRSLFPTLWGCHAVVPLMVQAGGGSIVNISSVATRGLNRVPYAAAKGGVNALTVCLAWEYSHAGIRVNAVAPGGTNAPPRHTPRQAGLSMTPTEGSGSAEVVDWNRQVVEQTTQSTFLGRYGSIEEQVAAILFLASDEASYITGTILPVAGGDTG